MGSFIGHAVPGSFFALFGVWFLYRVFVKYFMCQRAAAAMGDKSRTAYRNTTTFPCPCCPALPLEGLLKVTAAIAGMIGELATGFDKGKFIHLGNAQHMTMFFFFGLNGAVEVMGHYRLPMPPDLDFISAVLAFSMEALLFFYHLHGRSPMDVQVHMLLFYVVVACAVSTAMEMNYKTSVVPALCRAYFVLLQGTWFYQIGFVLYPPVGDTWNQENHKQMMMVTLLFTWHNAAIFVTMALVGALIYLKVKAMPLTLLYHELHLLQQAPHPALASLDADHTKGMLLSEDEEV